VTFTIYFYQYECNNVSPSGYQRIAPTTQQCDQYYGGVLREKPISGSGPDDPDPSVTLSVSGSGNTLSRTTIGPDSSGNGTFTLASSVVEAKTVTASPVPANDGIGTSASVTFANPTPPPAPVAKPKTPAPTPLPPPPTPPPPETPKPATITADGATLDASKPIEVDEDKPLVLSGKTVANGVVKLYIFSEPKTATATADKDGNWTYTIADLAAGEHHIEAEVTDPVTGQTSTRASVLAFTVKAVEKAATVAKETPKKRNLLLPLALVFLLIAAAAGGGFWWWKKKRLPKTPPHAPSAPDHVSPDSPVDEKTNDSSDTD
jgi:hypothetical protein